MTTTTTIYAVICGKAEVTAWNNRAQFVRWMELSDRPGHLRHEQPVSWAAEIRWQRDGEYGWASVDVIRGSDVGQNYENAKSYVQDNMACGIYEFCRNRD